MKTGDGRSRIDAVQVGEVAIDALGPTVALSAKMAYVDSRTGERCGYCNFNAWSPATLDKLRELFESMEQDVAASLFENTTGSGVNPASDPMDGVPGL